MISCCEPLLIPKLSPLLHNYPDIKVEFDVNYGFRDIVADRFDAGIRLGDTIDKDMIAIPSAPSNNGKPWRLPLILQHPSPNTHRSYRA